MNQDNQVEWKNEVDRAVVELAKICQTTPISEEIRTFASMVVENKRRQDEVEYVRSLQEKIERLEYEKSRVAKDSYAEGIRRAGEAIYKRQKDECEKNGSCFTSIQQTICDPCIYFSSALAALGSIEEEVKK